MEGLMDWLWARLERGEHTVLLNTLAPAALETQAGWTIVRVHCDGATSMWGPLERARREISGLLQHDFDQPSPYARTLDGLRHRLIGASPRQDNGPVETFNKLAWSTGGRAALVIDAVESADPATLQALRMLLAEHSRITLPLVLAFRVEPTEGHAASLLNSLRKHLGEDSVWGDGSEDIAPQAVAEPLALDTLTAEQLEVLRAAAVVGEIFEAPLLAGLIERTPLQVLCALQRAVDGGVPLRDLGEGSFSLHGDHVAQLRASLLPSLRAAWNERLAALVLNTTPEALSPTLELNPELEQSVERVERVPLDEDVEGVPPVLPSEGRYAELFDSGGEHVPVVSDVDASCDSEAGAGQGSETGEEDAEAAREQEAASAVEAEQSGDEEVGEEVGEEPPPVALRMPLDHVRDELDTAGVETASLFAAPERDVDFALVEDSVVQEDEAPLRSFTPLASARAPSRISTPAPRHTPPHTSTRRAGGRDHARAANHLEEAGRAQEAIEHLLAAAREVDERHDAWRALMLAQRALELSTNLPQTPTARHLRARSLMELGRIQWHGAALGAPFVLQDALNSMELALEELPPQAPPALLAELSALIAGVCYDIGDLDSLQRASEELTSASRLLLEQGASLDAARLLNDQAAVLVRSGDPVQAVYLLERSRKLFDELRMQDMNDPVVTRELAETHHLLARMPLHARIRPGQDAEACAMSMEHASSAAALYRSLDDAWELARVWETFGRLELMRRRPNRAEEHLYKALKLQQRLGDVTGLARTTGALAELFVMSGSPDRALQMLTESINLNMEKGSPSGLAFNHATLHLIASAERALSEQEERVFRREVTALHAYLYRAAESLGVQLEADALF